MNAPFASANDPEFEKLLQLARTGTTMPDRHRAGGELLDEVYNDEKSKVVRVINGQIGTLAGYQTKPPWTKPPRLI